jgi:hypothetical protein
MYMYITRLLFIYILICILYQWVCIIAALQLKICILSINCVANFAIHSMQYYTVSNIACISIVDCEQAHHAASLCIEPMILRVLAADLYIMGLPYVLPGRCMLLQSGAYCLELDRTRSRGACARLWHWAHSYILTVRYSTPCHTHHMPQHRIHNTKYWVKKGGMVVDTISIHILPCSIQFYS